MLNFHLQQTNYMLFFVFYLIHVDNIYHLEKIQMKTVLYFFITKCAKINTIIKIKKYIIVSI